MLRRVDNKSKNLFFVIFLFWMFLLLLQLTCDWCRKSHLIKHGCKNNNYIAESAVQSFLFCQAPDVLRILEILNFKVLGSSQNVLVSFVINTVSWNEEKKNIRFYQKTLLKHFDGLDLL